MRSIAIEHNERASELEDEGLLEDAIEAYRQAINADPTWSAPWYNLGLLHKYQLNWEESLRCNERAVELSPQSESAWWNLGIAATALGDWAKARRAWQQYGIQIPAGEGPLEMNLGVTPIRLNPDDEAEVVWCDRIDPARAVIQSIPLSDSGHRYGDIVLHDGAPNGYRQLDEREVPVFDALELLQSSEFGTFVITLDNVTDTEMESLQELLDDHDFVSEEWSTSIQMLCRECSEGRPFSEEHQHEPIQLDNRHLAVAAMSGDELHAILQQWQETVSNVTIVEISCALAPESSS